jgi:RNA-binding protein
MTPELTPAERKRLRARAHALNPVVMIGNGGLTPTVLNEIDGALRSHELIKIRVFSDDHDIRAAMLVEISARLGAAPVQHVGKILVVYRPPAPGAENQARKSSARRKTPRRTKRSYQR